VKGFNAGTSRMGSSSSRNDELVRQVEALSEIASGLHFSDDGTLVAVSEERRSELTNQLKNLAQGDRPNARFIGWFFSSGNDRTIFPASEVRVSDWVANALLTNPNETKEWIRNAIANLPDHSLLHIALAGFETDSKSADFLRSFGLARLPKNSVYCARAAELLMAQRRPELALAAADKALRADPGDVTAQRVRVKALEALPQ
jgi:tetratricopeptide (TPR) repeat protein